MAVQRIIVAIAALSCLMEAQTAQVAVASTACTGETSGTSGSCRQAAGVAQSSRTGPNGVTEGECAYFNQQGQSVKVKFQEFPDGTINAKANSGENGVAELARCREAARAGQVEAQMTFEQIQANNQRVQEQIQRQHQQLQDEIRRQQEAIFNQHEAIFNQRNFQAPAGFNPVRFPNFNQGGFGPQF